MRFVVVTVGSLCLALSAFGQITTTMLRARYGTPTKSDAPASESFRAGKGDGGLVVNYASAETFKVRDNIEMVVNYGPSGQVCRIDLPGREQPVGRQASTDAETNRQLHEVLDEVVLPSIRGKELRSMLEQFGLPAARWTEYENLTIVEIGPQTRIQLKFKGCRVQSIIH